ncbi:16S rRNA (adenine(1518)-N(6)/adenine(1519)-N(6))-dimethyltransferase RsmA [Stenotrophomonas sp. YIM B06876]|uniref:16S rRNA (adenine(1518)-N(6)/adenine(1519)-N(6))- dimethyltransferase RsmA n=1 Tax=Stenotrophomonas sp. YIM B06876 TaxID=3060211 RepID=UPI002738A3C9|nr:16S rRNA (adenine(1518)-N(6)/adenine(1519)-N(6))-dimethyltransferase RsmA [Stenotrophomonas sp. YIM B06876]
MNPTHSPRDGAGFHAPPKKSLGQHFLADRTYVDRIVRAVNPKAGDRLVEIGPGQGAITLPMLRQHPQLTVIEFDRDLIAPLTEAAATLGELTIIHRDVLQVDFTELAAGTQIRLVGNLPYNISSPILFHALEHAAAISDMTFMLQKEVVDRMAAAPGSKVYGRLSVMLQAWCEVTSLFVVPPGAFRPPPKVDSAVVRLVPRDPAQVGINDKARFAEVVRAAFGQRRKTLRNALNGVCDAAQFEAAGVRSDARAEQLEVADFIRLANTAPI